MTDALIAAAILTAISCVGVAALIRESNLRWKAMEDAFFARLEEQEKATRAAYAPPRASLEIPKWEPWTPDAGASAARVEEAIAALNAVVASGETDDEAPPVPIDLGELADRLSEAGYDGGALRLAGVEVRSDRHVVVHLEPQRP